MTQKLDLTDIGADLTRKLNQDILFCINRTVGLMDDPEDKRNALLILVATTIGALARLEMNGVVKAAPIRPLGHEEPENLRDHIYAVAADSTFLALNIEGLK